MSSVHRKKGRKDWYCVYYMDGKQKWANTGIEATEANREAAEASCRQTSRAARKAEAGKLTPDEALKLIDEVTNQVRDQMHHTLNKVLMEKELGELPKSSARAHMDAWLGTKAVATTHSRYKTILTRFMDSIGAKADRDICLVRPQDIQIFVNKQARELSPATALLSLKVLRSYFKAAVGLEMIQSNPADKVEFKIAKRKQSRRDFDLAELSRILAKAEGEMKGVILFGIYTGARLGDIATATWRQLDLQKKLWEYTSQKTARFTAVPLHPALLDYLLILKVPEDPDWPVFPDCAKAAAKRVGTISNWFSDVLVDAGLITKKISEAVADDGSITKRKSHHVDEKDRKGRKAAREKSKISFHSLRHSFVTLLKRTGASDAIAKELAGHESDLISQKYTHLDTEDTRAAIEALPTIKPENGA